jgi:hypothetical protein
LGQTSAPQTVTLSNNGGMPLLIAGISISGYGDFAITNGTNTCGASLAAGSSCTFQIAFTPLAAGTRSATLVVNDNSINTPQLLTLSGTGLDFALNISGSLSQTVTSGQQASYIVMVTPAAAGLTSAITFACTNAPTDATCTLTTSPATPTLAANVTVYITVSTGVNPTANTSSPSVLFGHRGLITFAFLPILGMGLYSRRHRRLLAILLIAAFAFSNSGCGSGSRTIPVSTSSGNSTVYTTPNGTYTLTLSGTAAGITHTQPLTLIVQ